MTGAPVVLPLTPQQRGVYFLHCLAPDSAVYNVPIVLRVRGGLDRERLQRAVDVLVTRHQALRLTVRESDGQVLQLIHPADAAPRVEVNWTSLPGADLTRAAAEVVRYAGRPFDVVSGPLMRVDVVELGGEEHAVSLCFHHLIIDEIAATALASELNRLYEDPAALPGTGPEHQYAEFCAGLLAEPDPKGLGFWRERLAGMPVLPLPEEHVPEDHGLFTGDRVGFTVPEAVSARVAEVSRAHRVSEFMVFHAALLVLLHRWTGAEDIAVGTPMSGRVDERFARTVGFFQNTVVLRGTVDPGQSFAALLKASRRTVLEGLQRQHVPFETVVDAVRPSRESTRNPLFQVALVFNRRKVEQDWSLPGLTVEPLPFPWPTSHFDLALTLLHEYGVLKGDFAYSAQRFSRATAERLTAVFLRLLGGLLADPDAPVGDIDLMDAEERARVRELSTASGRQVLDGRGRSLPLGFHGAVHTADPADGRPVPTGERGRFAADGRFELWRDPVEAALEAHPGVLAAVVVRVAEATNGSPDTTGERPGAGDGRPGATAGRSGTDTKPGATDGKPDPADGTSGAMNAASGARHGGGEQLVACVVPRPGVEPPAPRELSAHLQARVPAHLLPQRVVVRDEIPTGADGRPDPAALAAVPEPAEGTPEETADDAPRDAVERRLVELFEELLGVPGLGRYDNFFDYGGQSLLAVRLVARVAEELGRPLGVGVFMNNPTVAALARALAEDGDGTADPAGLVRLRTPAGDPSDVAVALIHPVGGTLMCYAPLVGLLPEHTEVVGLERVAGAHPDDTAYADLVDRYATTLADALPGRRIALLGWSLGGVLAHSIADRLTELGHDVALVALLDSLAQRTAEDAERMSATSAELLALAGSVLRDGTGVLGTTAGQRLLMRRFGVDLDLLRDTPADQAARMLEDWARLLGLVAECAPAKTTAPLQLFLCADNPAGYPEALAASWEGLGGALELCRVPGTHIEVLASPAVEQVAAAFTERTGRS
ncbi:condensation domain-containing protein [Streptomyces sp. NBC_00140]|uniref:condensation domain-containing protein n=1 Tax=Streptomyces sp. NBC_00140 TaxID=2975664 RepID=UPI00224CE051|nr:condensation domain-containing protein [Streptomyces sp. NBC_00140]MCX5331786.1 condensation domain-containing protein [Streptomyces sp. NBC_00140]